MKKLTLAALAAFATLVFAGAGWAALNPGVHDPGNTKCVTSSLTKGWLHLEKNCPTSTDAAAGAQITGAEGTTFRSASFTLKSASQCKGGSPRFIVVTDTGLYPLGCNNVTPTISKKGTATYVFTAETLAAAGQQVPTPTGTISFVSVLIDVQGVADLKHIRFNGVPQKATKRGKKADLAAACKKGGWKTFTNPAFKNQGQCVKNVVHARNALRKSTKR
jgi:hypothetical protein